MSVDHRFPFQKLDAYVVARDFMSAVVAAKIRDAELRDQATRGAKSAFLNLAEGLPSDSGPMRKKFFETARRSVYETVAALDGAEVLGATSVDASLEVHRLGVRLDALLKGLLK